MVKSTFELEEQLNKEGYRVIIGIDEAGRGPLCGPVVSAAALYKNSNFNIPESERESFDLIRDSKTLSQKQREKMNEFIIDNFHVGIGICSHETVDRINILEASFLAMKKALVDLKKNLKNGMQNMNDVIVLLDGKKEITNFSFKQKAIVSGDKYVKSISAASIIAKFTRDGILMEAHKKYPQYGFDKHKGYGTKFHLEMIEKHGPCEIHRKSFNPIATLAKSRK